MVGVEGGNLEKILNLTNLLVQELTVVNGVLFPMQDYFTYIKKVDPWIVGENQSVHRKPQTSGMGNDSLSHTRICHKQDLNPSGERHCDVIFLKEGTNRTRNDSKILRDFGLSEFQSPNYKFVICIFQIYEDYQLIGSM